MKKLSLGLMSVVFTALLLQGCGQSGPLYLSAPGDGDTTSAVNAHQPAIVTDKQAAAKTMPDDSAVDHSAHQQDDQSTDAIKAKTLPDGSQNPLMQSKQEATKVGQASKVA